MKKPMIKIEDKEEPLYFCDAISGVTIGAEYAGKVVGTRKSQTWRPLSLFERIKHILGLSIKNLEMMDD
ncbi:unnamed protein product [marine sediment metagenome]|uniref:Uncharacterized protein n=1 Tax=marine sediment metagenome TaxID=412755 RepID=X1R2D3_9ZZZZ